MAHRRAPPELVSVIMPVRDGARWVGAQLDALAAQDYPDPWELVVLDDRSTDGTPAIVERRLAAIPHGRLLRGELASDEAGAHQPNRAARCRNAGAAAAGGELLAFCDADDVVSTGWLSALARAAPEADLIACSLDVKSLNDPIVRRWHGSAPVQRPHPLHRFLPWASTSGFAVWAEVFAALGGFDESHPGAEDIDFSWRAQLAGYRLLCASEARVAYRYRRGLRATARQEYRWGKADARLFRDFAPAGMRRNAAAYALGSWGRTVLGAPLLPFCSWQRGRWTIRAARRWGRLVGSAQQRVFFP